MTQLTYLLPSEAERLLEKGCLVFCERGTLRFSREKGLQLAYMQFPEGLTLPFEGGVGFEPELIAFGTAIPLKIVVELSVCCRREDFERHLVTPGLPSLPIPEWLR
jgi:hypothetical protein